MFKTQIFVWEDFTILLLLTSRGAQSKYSQSAAGYTGDEVQYNGPVHYSEYLIRYPEDILAIYGVIISHLVPNGITDLQVNWS
jgi:hypothetical protein